MRLSEDVYARLDAQLAASDAEFNRHYPGEPSTRAPVHTVYVPADRFTFSLPRDWGQAASTALADHVPDAAALAGVLNIDDALAAEVLPRVRRKLTDEPIEDLRIDFEDGYGTHADHEEDEAAVAAAHELAELASPPAYIGIRIKSLEAGTRRRGIRTLDLFLGGMPGQLRQYLLITLPKIVNTAQVAAFVKVCEALEAAYQLPADSLRLEIQIETPQAVLGADGAATVARLIAAGRGRIIGLPYGTYDYSAALGVTAPYQSLEHPAADHAKAVMQLAAAGTGVRVSDGSTNVLPVGSAEAVIAAWRLHGRLVRRSLERGFYQGWDLHPAHLVSRYAATFAFFRSDMPAACDRLRAYLARADSSILDEPATAQAMATLLVRGLDCGAIDEVEVTSRSGATRSELMRLYHRGVR